MQLLDLIERATDAEALTPAILSDLLEGLMPWAASETVNEDESLIPYLAQNNASIRPLCALLRTALEGPAQDPAIKLLSARIFVLLLGVPGGEHVFALPSPHPGAQTVFHPLLLRESINCLKMFDQQKPVQPPQKKRKGKRKFEDAYDADALPALLLEDLATLFQSFSLSVSAESRMHAVEVLASLVGRSSTPSQRLDVLFACLHSLLLPLHGPPESVVAALFQHFLPVVLMTNAAASGSPPAWATAARGHALAFLAELVSVQAKDAHVFLQHLLVRVPDKADYRQHAATAVKRLVDALPSEEGLDRRVCAHFIEFLIRYSASSKANHRLFAVTVAWELLKAKDHLDDDRSLVRVVIDRCGDRSPATRSKALSALSTVIEIATTDEAISAVLGNPLPILRARMSDDKPPVRKAVVSTVEAVASAQQWALEDGDYAMIADRCSDIAASVRKQAMGTLTALLRLSSSDAMKSAWLDAIPPMITDVEAAVQDRCIELIEEILFTPLVAMNEDAWLLLDMVNNDALRFIARVGFVLSTRKKLSSALFRALLKMITAGKHLVGAWNLLAALAPSSIGSVDAEAVASAWEKQKAPKALIVLRSIAASLGSDRAESIAVQLCDLLSRFASDVIEIGPMVACLLVLRKRDFGWAHDLLERCEAELAAYVLPLTEDVTEEVDTDVGRIVRVLYTLGDVAELTRSHVSNVLQTLVSPTLGGVDHDIIAPAVRAHALVTLGKLCLQDHPLAKKCVGAFARELRVASSPAVRNNAMVVLCDLCMRYTALADPYIPVIASSIRDPSPLVRSQTVTLLTKLLQEDYIKWRGLLFFRFVVALVDEDPSVKALANHCLVHILERKAKGLFVNNFVDCVYHLNAFIEHPQFNQYPQSAVDAALFDVSGAEKEALRVEIYTTMLNEMSDEHKFQLTGRLSQDVLGALADEIISLDRPGASAVLRDALIVLASPEIKLASQRNRTAVVEDEESAMNAAKDKVLSKVMRKNMIENVIPVIVEVKRELERRRSPLLRDVMVLLGEIVHDYKEEVEDVLLADKQLAHEIEFDLQRAEVPQKAPATKSDSLTVPVMRKRIPPPEEAVDLEESQKAKSDSLTVPVMRKRTPPPMVLPVPSPMPARLYSAKKQKQKAGDADVLLYSPDKPTPPPKMWNVTSPVKEMVPSDDGSWQCLKCTLLNEAKAKKCSACGVKKGVSAPAEPVGSPAAKRPKRRRKLRV